jgi:hypothetical protein
VKALGWLALRERIRRQPEPDRPIGSRGRTRSPVYLVNPHWVPMAGVTKAIRRWRSEALRYLVRRIIYASRLAVAGLGSQDFPDPSKAGQRYPCRSTLMLAISLASLGITHRVAHFGPPIDTAARTIATIP